MSQQGGNQFAAQGDQGVYTVNQSTEGLEDDDAYDPFGSAVEVGTAETPAVPETDVVGEDVLTNVSYLRLLLQENIPPNGSDSDTMFLDEHLVAILNRSANLMSYAAFVGWTIKAGALLVLTDRSDGLSEKKLSQAAVAAQKQADKWLVVTQAEMPSYARSLAPGGATFRPWDRSWENLWNQVWDASHIDRFWLPWNVIEG